MPRSEYQEAASCEDLEESFPCRRAAISKALRGEQVWLVGGKLGKPVWLKQDCVGHRV